MNDRSGATQTTKGAVLPPGGAVDGARRRVLEGALRLFATQGFHGSSMRELATLVAIGAEPGQMRTLLSAEAAAITASGVTVGLVSGAIVGWSLLQILSGVFDPAPDRAAIPLAAIAALIVVVSAAAAVAVGFAVQAIRRLDVVGALRER